MPSAQALYLANMKNTFLSIFITFLFFLMSLFSMHHPIQATTGNEEAPQDQKLYKSSNLELDPKEREHPQMQLLHRKFCTMEAKIWGHYTKKKGIPQKELETLRSYFSDHAVETHILICSLCEGNWKEGDKIIMQGKHGEIISFSLTSLQEKYLTLCRFLEDKKNIQVLLHAPKYQPSNQEIAIYQAEMAIWKNGQKNQSTLSPQKIHMRIHQTRKRKRQKSYTTLQKHYLEWLNWLEIKQEAEDMEPLALYVV